MNPFKENLRAYFHLLKSLLIVIRVMMFEKFTPIVFFFYALLVLSLAFVVSVIHWSAALIILISGVLLFTKVLARFQFLKRSLIRKGDRVEYADPNASGTSQIFKKAKIILKMRSDEAERSKLISSELIEGNRYFFLVETDTKPCVIAYDWIIGLSPEILD